MPIAQTHANVKIGAAYTGLHDRPHRQDARGRQDLAIMRAMPGMTVLAPCDAAESAAMTRWATATPGPVYLRLGREAGPDVFDVGLRLRAAAGPPRSARAPTCCWCPPASRPPGPSRRRSSSATRHLGGRAPCPLDQARRRGRHRGRGGQRAPRGHGGGAHGDRWPGRAAWRRSSRRHDPRPVIRIGIEDTWGESAPNAWLLERHGLTPERVAERVRGLEPGVRAPGPARSDR